MPAPPKTRLPLGRTPRRLPFERRLRLWLIALGLVLLLAVALSTWSTSRSPSLTLGVTMLAALVYLLAAAALTEQIVRPLQTLSNVIAALREQDFSFRTRGGRRGDALGDLSLELNLLAATLQHQRNSALDALTLVERVLTSMQSPVLAFDAAGTLKLHNAAAQSLPGGTGPEALAALLLTPDQALYPASASAPVRWSVRRTGFRLQGVPHTLFVLSDVSAALRAEERLAWQRLIRVLGHEINNSLTPIHSIAGSLRTRLARTAVPQELLTDFDRGLGVIEDRAASLNRFLQAYQQLSRLPAPTLRPSSVPQLIASVAVLETRLVPTVVPGPPLTFLCDPDQIQQLLINLLSNATEAALYPEQTLTPQVTLTWQPTPTELHILVEDNGPGITNPANLFVPFYTTKPGGSGIGLVLAQNIASAHGGTVTLLPRTPHPGCTARLSLPQASPLDQQA